METQQAGVTAAVATDAPVVGLERKLGLFDMTMLVMGSVIGVGIFASPHEVAKILSTPSAILAAWIVGGLVTLAGSLVYADLVRRRPHVGGQYVYLREAYHPALAFVYGWSLLFIVQSGAIASVAITLARYFVPLISPELAADPKSQAAGGLNSVIAALAILLVSLINCAGLRASSVTQNIFMMLKIVAISAVVIAGCLSTVAVVDASALTSLEGEASTATLSGQSLTAFLGALVMVFFSYGGSHCTTFLAGEVQDAPRNLPRALVAGLLGVMALYVALNFACLRVLGVEYLAETQSPASDVMRLAFGEGGAIFISVGIVLSALGFLSQATLMSPRVYYAMAKQGLFFRSVAWIHPRTQVPVVAIMVQSAVAILFAVTGTFADIVEFVMTVETTFFTLTALSLFIIRWRDHQAGVTLSSSRLGHPWPTLLFAGVNAAIVANLFVIAPRNSLIAVALALAGLPVYFLWALFPNRA